MYCPKCNRHYKKKQRGKYVNIRTCTCGYYFVFGHYDHISDRLMLFLENKASKNGTRYFSINKLYAVYEKRQAKHRQHKQSQSAFYRIHDTWQTNSSLKSHKFFEKRIQCPKCNQYHHKKKQDTTNRCNCGYRFVLSGQNDVIKDRLMFFLEKKASKNGTRYFTIDNLYAVYEKRQAEHRQQKQSKSAFSQIHETWQKNSSLKSHHFFGKIERQVHCPKCNQHHRQDTRCICGYHFVLSGKHDAITDRFMLFLEQKASKNGTRYFRINRLYAVYKKYWLNHQPRFGFFFKKPPVNKDSFSQLYNVWQRDSSLRSDQFFEKRTRCPKCNQYFYKKKQDTTNRCTCGYHFVLTGQNDAITDRLMLFLERKASNNNTRYFTMDTLYAVYLKHPANSQLSHDLFAQKHYHWQRQSSLRSDKYIEKPSLEQPENSIGAEVFRYGVERIIVVDEPLKVDLFVKNNEHIKKQALIISSEGYPAYLKPQLQNILATQPNVPVGFLCQPKRTIAEQKTRFEQNCLVKLQDGQVWDMRVNQKSTTCLKADKPDISVNQNPTVPLDTKNVDSIENESNDVTSVGIIVTIISMLIGAGIFYHYSTVHYPTEREKSDFPKASLPDNQSNNISVSESNGTDEQGNSQVETEVLNEQNINASPTCYKLTVNAIPLDSRIRIMNIKPKYKHGICLKKGHYDIYVTHKNHKSYRKWIKIEDRGVSISVTLDNK